MSNRSLRSMLISIFILTSTVPLLCVGLFLSYNTVRLMRENTRTLMQQNLKQIDDNMNLLLDSYEDLVYQIYTDDDVVRWMDSLNAGEDEAVTINQLRRFMNALLYSKDDIGAITVISDSGRMVTTHTLNAATYENPWLSQFHMDQKTLYDTVSQGNGFYVFPTEYATNFAGEDHYLFHIAHRIIDYHDLKKQCGIVIVSLDEDLLHSVLYMEEEGKEGGNISGPGAGLGDRQCHQPADLPAGSREKPADHRGDLAAPVLHCHLSAAEAGRKTGILRSHGNGCDEGSGSGRPDRPDPHRGNPAHRDRDGGE